LAGVILVLPEIVDQSRCAIDRKQEAIGLAIAELDEVGAVDRLERPMSLGCIR